MFKELQSNDMLICIICIILGYMFAKYVSGNGFSVGGNYVAKCEPDKDNISSCESKCGSNGAINSNGGQLAGCGLNAVTNIWGKDNTGTNIYPRPEAMPMRGTVYIPKDGEGLIAACCSGVIPSPPPLPSPSPNTCTDWFEKDPNGYKCTGIPSEKANKKCPDNDLSKCNASMCCSKNTCGISASGQHSWQCPTGAKQNNDVKCPDNDLSKCSEEVCCSPSSQPGFENCQYMGDSETTSTPQPFSNYRARIHDENNLKCANGWQDKIDECTDVWKNYYDTYLTIPYDGSYCMQTQPGNDPRGDRGHCSRTCIKDGKVVDASKCNASKHNNGKITSDFMPDSWMITDKSGNITRDIEIVKQNCETSIGTNMYGLDGSTEGRPDRYAWVESNRPTATINQKLTDCQCPDSSLPTNQKQSRRHRRHGGHGRYKLL